MKVTNHTELWDSGLAWYFPSATRRVHFNSLQHGLRVYGFRTYLTLPVHWISIKLSKIPRTILLLHCDQLIFSFHTNVFDCFHSVMPLFKFVKPISWIRLCYILICTAFKSHMERRKARVSAQTNTILTTTAITYHSLNCFSHVIYVPQSSSH